MASFIHWFKCFVLVFFFFLQETSSLVMSFRPVKISWNTILEPAVYYLTFLHSQLKKERRKKKKVQVWINPLLFILVFLSKVWKLSCCISYAIKNLLYYQFSLHFSLILFTQMSTCIRTTPYVISFYTVLHCTVYNIVPYSNFTASLLH